MALGDFAVLVPDMVQAVVADFHHFNGDTLAPLDGNEVPYLRLVRPVGDFAVGAFDVDRGLAIGIDGDLIELAARARGISTWTLPPKCLPTRPRVCPRPLRPVGRPTRKAVRRLEVSLSLLSSIVFSFEPSMYRHELNTNWSINFYFFAGLRNPSGGRIHFELHHIVGKLMQGEQVTAARSIPKLRGMVPPEGEYSISVSVPFVGSTA